MTETVADTSVVAAQAVSKVIDVDDDVLPVVQKRKTTSHKCSWIFTASVFLCALLPSLCMWLFVFPGFLQPDHAATVAYLATGTYDAWHSIFWALLAKPLLYDSPSYGWYGLAQLLLYAGAVTFSILRLRRIGVVKRVGVCVLLVVFSLSPCYVIYNVTYSSDIVFSTLLIPYTVLLAELAVTHLDCLSRPRFLVGLALLTFVLLELRKNALLIPMFLCVALVIMRRDLWKRILLGVLVPVVAFLGVNAIFDAAFNVRKSPSQELMSVPALQIGRVYAEELPMPEDVNEYFSSIRPASKWKEYYDIISTNADYEKQGLNLNHEFVKNWLRLGMIYPKVYFDAYWNLMRYYFSMDSRPKVDTDFSQYSDFTVGPCDSSCKPEYVHQMTVPYTAHQQSILRRFHRMFDKPWMMQTVGRVFFNTSLPFWVLLVSFMILVISGKGRRMLIVLIPLACLFAAFICFSPVVLMRYVMEMYYMVPVVLSVVWYCLPWRKDTLHG